MRGPVIHMRPLLSLLSFFLLGCLSIGDAQMVFEPNLNGETKIYTSQGTHKDYFGHAVAVHEDVVIVGAYAANTIIPESGSAFSFKRNVTRNESVWKESDFIAATKISPHDYFGGSISIWDNFIVIGAYVDQSMGSKSGSAFIFKWSHGKWKEVQSLSSMLDSAADYFGQDVGIHENRIIVGAYGHSDPASYYNGAAYVYKHASSSNKWTLQSFLRPQDSEDYQMFGYSVVVHNNTIVVGAYGDSSSGSNTGAAYIFKQVYSEVENEDVNATSPTIIEQVWIEVQKLIPGDPKSHANFGINVDLSNRYFETYKGDYTNPNYESYDIVVGSNLANGAESVTGAAYVFRSPIHAGKHSSLWTQQAKLYASDGAGDERFGSSVAIHGPYLAVGAPEDRARGTDSGSAYIFELTASESWTFQRKLMGNDTVAYDNFGSSCAIYDTTLVVGAEKAFGFVDSSGAAYIFAADGVTRKTSTKSFFAEEKDQFVLFIAVLPILLILIPPVVFSGAMYFISLYRSPKASAESSSHSKQEILSSSMSPLEEYASTHGLASSSAEMDDSADSVDDSVRSSTPLNLTSSRRHLLTRKGHAPVNSFQIVPGREGKKAVEQSNDSERTHLLDRQKSVATFSNKKLDTIEEAVKKASEQSSPMIFHHLLHSENSRHNA